MTDERTPALTPAMLSKEWAEHIARQAQFSRTSGHGEIGPHIYATFGVGDGATEDEKDAVEIHWGNSGDICAVWNRHRLAALCLYQQPFGFTQEDLQALDRAVEMMGSEFPHSRVPDMLGALHDRIASLLPPAQDTQP